MFLRVDTIICDCELWKEYFKNYKSVKPGKVRPTTHSL